MEEDRRQDALDEALRRLLAGDPREARALSERMPAGETRELMARLCRSHEELNDYAQEIAKGNFSVPTPPRDNFLAMSLKNLHSKLVHITWQIGQVAQGDYRQVVEYMGSLSDGFNEMTRQLRQRREEMEYLAGHDGDTGLLNRSFFMRGVYDLINARPDEVGALLYCGLDNLKHINDTFGREAGDKYILLAARMFRIFEADGALSARLSGDEFALYLHGFADAETAFDKVRTFVQEQLGKHMFAVHGVSHKLRSSIGVAIYPQDTRFVDDLVRFAAYAMYEVKRRNRGSIARFDSAAYSKSRGFFDKQIAFETLLDERQIHFAFQPIVDMRNGSVFGYEALMRAKLPDFPSPLDILDIAENQAKLLLLEKLTFEVLFAWMDGRCGALGGKKIFFNIISDHFLNESEMPHIHPNHREIIPHLVFELLENSAESRDFMKNIAAFRKRFGAMIALDDYGTGHSNHYRLLNLEADIVKIDRFFIADIHRNEDKRVLMEDIVAFCYSKDIKILAEGVEKPEELRVCMRLGIDYAQGYYFAEPAFALLDPAADFKEKLDAAR
ncbi:MAG: EAL domain-containing protein [Clostridiales Family XIII bacterium]|jgi:diguanylate cyclase (GGDEF)-like protein|nr:EAL domain-containing protein [Clostridiales Family XIII bacterium]